MTTTTTTELATQVYQVFIKAPPEKIWDAITKPEYTTKYFHGARVETTDGHAPVVIRRDVPRECWAWGWGDWRGRDDGRWYDDDRGERRRGRHPGRPIGWNDRDYDRWRKEYDRARRQQSD